MHGTTRRSIAGAPWARGRTAWLKLYLCFQTGRDRGGSFTSAGGVPVHNIRALYLDDQRVSSLDAGVSSEVYTLTALPTGDVIAAGYFTSAGGVSPTTSRGMTRPQTLGRPWAQGRTAMRRPLRCSLLAILAVGGSFSTAGGCASLQHREVQPSEQRLVRLGHRDVHAGQRLSVLPTGDVIAGGDFTTIGGVQANHIARYNRSQACGRPWRRNRSLGSRLGRAPDRRRGSRAATFALADARRSTTLRGSTGYQYLVGLGRGTNSFVFALAQLPSGDLIAGGFFTVAGGVPANYIARYGPATNTGRPWARGWTTPCVR